MSKPTILYYGSERPPPEQMQLKAGPLTMVFEPEGAFLRYIRLGETEILRGIYAAVRDYNWDTIAPRVANLRLETTRASFRLTFEVTHRERDIDFVWQGELSSDEDGTVRFIFDGVAHSSFKRNRIGFCVLHPAICSGQPCTVEKVDGTVEEGVFPRSISPHQPLKDMRAISYEAIAGITVEVSFEGDVFEMEDQRNWTDASYKTYCTPLGLPFPVEVKEGTRIQQVVTLRLKGKVEELEAFPAEPILELSVAEAPPQELLVPLPKLGLGLASHGEALTEREVERLRVLNLSHLRTDLKLFDEGYKDVLERAVREAQALGVRLELALFVSDAADEELRAFAAEIKRHHPKVARWLVFHQDEKSTRARWLLLARQHLRDYEPTAKFFGGTNAYFTELNRERPPLEVLDGVAYSINPQVHAFDNASLVETLEAQLYTVTSARGFAPDLPIAIGPITLKPRFNPNATGPEPEPGEGELPSQVDPRQMSLFGAGWTLGSLKYLLASDVSSLTYYETTGWRGVMETEAGSPVPERFPSYPGGVFPLYHVLADVGEFAGGSTLISASSDPLNIEILALHKDGRTRILMANLSPVSQHVHLDCPQLTQMVRVKTLSAANAGEAMQEPERFREDQGLRQEVRGGRMELCLSPYAVVCIDTEEEPYP